LNDLSSLLRVKFLPTQKKSVQGWSAFVCLYHVLSYGDTAGTQRAHWSSYWACQSTKVMWSLCGDPGRVVA